MRSCSPPAAPSSSTTSAGPWRATAPTRAGRGGRGEIVAGGVAIADGNDVAAAAGAQALVGATVEQFGRVDVLINSAGIIRWATSEADADNLATTSPCTSVARSARRARRGRRSNSSTAASS
jgi:NAD(P)-dependent dehydrogenase (short-subunit alcohol dehydrogenase family)